MASLMPYSGGWAGCRGWGGVEGSGDDELLGDVVGLVASQLVVPDEGSKGWGVAICSWQAEDADGCCAGVGVQAGRVVDGGVLAVVVDLNGVLHELC